MKTRITFLILALFASSFVFVQGQSVVSTSDFFVAQPAADRMVAFDVEDEGVSTPITWGLDLAWLDENNIRRGVAFMGIDNVEVIRASFQPIRPLVNDDISEGQIDTLNWRLNIIEARTNPGTKITLNCDHPKVDSWYVGNALRWAKLIDATTRRVQERGHEVITVAPFNEPDYTQVGQGTKDDFYNIAGELRQMSRFNNIRISGGNTLNCDEALPWYNHLKTRLDEGNTHQLAGSFDSYANFFTEVRNNGHHATADELHNVMEAMVGVEYGMQTGIWWGTAEYARGEFVKTTRHGKRLAYAEHRPNWTSAAVYRNAEGKLQAFGGTSERQAATTSYRFLSKDKPLFFDGYGPQNEYVMTLPGGTGYQQGQTNAERVVNISWGDDVQPVINGTYVLVNRNSQKVMEVADASMDNGATVRQYTYSAGATHQQWNVVPVDPGVGGDFSYFKITAVHSGKSLDVYNFSLNNNDPIKMYDDNSNAVQQWYLEYVEDGWFRIRSRFSAKCLTISGNSTRDRAPVVHYDPTGHNSQLWRFLPVDAPIEFVAPSAPANLSAVAQRHSVWLEWDDVGGDVDSYIIFRSETPNGDYETIARNVETLAFVDNTVSPGKSYYYKVKAIDRSLNRSGYSNAVSVRATGGDNKLVAYYNFDDNTLDKSENLLHGSFSGTTKYTTGKIGTKAAEFDKSNSYQLPPTVADFDEITIEAWVYPRYQWTFTNLYKEDWQRIFDFGNGESEYMFLTVRAEDTGKLRFAIKNGGDEQRLDAPLLTRNTWSHVAVTLGNGTARIYVNGTKTAESNSFTIKPSDFKPVLNYIGRSQFPGDRLFWGYVDDLKIYNYVKTNFDDRNSAVSYLSVTEDNLVFDDIDNTQRTFRVSGINLTNNIVLSAPAGITLNPSTVAAADAAAGKTITATWDPGVLGTILNGVITISSTGVGNQTINFATSEDSDCTNFLAPAKNLIDDPYFNNPEQPGWGNHIATSDNAYCGSFSGKVWGQGGGSGSLDRTVAWNAETPYIIRAYVNTNADGFVLGLGNAYVGGVKDNETYNSISNTGGAWQLFENTFVTGADATYGSLWFNNYASGINGTGYIDNLELYEARIVSFDTNGGSAVSPIYVVKGEKIAAAPETTLPGYIFQGWYKDAGYDTAWNFATDVVDSNTTLYAKWQQDVGVGIYPSNDVVVKTEYFSLVGVQLEKVDQTGLYIVKKVYDSGRVEVLKQYIKHMN
ncbi:MAG: hypothetical protein GX296_00790 [Bacteroidales bacterium]|nr:hypothetical protein [Bacteroidales bacterium]